MIPLIKMNLKLLLRNKMFLFFLAATPILSVFILSLKTENTVYYDNGDAAMIVELEDCTQKAVYLGNTSAYIVKVYDASGSALSEYILNKMAESGIFSVCRCDVSHMTEEDVLTQAKNDAYDDRAGALLYLKKDFEQAVLGEWPEQGLQIYIVSEDERRELFEAELTALLVQIKQAGVLTEAEGGAVIRLLEDAADQMPGKKIVSLAQKEGAVLTEQQINQKTQIGYAFAFITLGFLFCGVCVAHTVIEEQNNKVYTRIMLSKMSSRAYFFSKFVLTFVICFMQTLVLAVCLPVVKGLDFGINFASFLLVIFFLGLIFSILSVLLGILLGDVMSSNYTIFAIWSISALLSGLFFPLDNTTPALKTFSYFMPQRWFMDVVEMLLTGDRHGYSVLFYVTLDYLIVIVSVGSAGLKIKQQEV